MTRGGIEHVFGCRLDVAGLTDEELSVALRDASDAVNAAEARRLVVAAEWDRRRAWGADGAYSGRCWVADRCTLSRAGAGSVLRTAQVVASAPLVAAAVAEGSLPVSKAEVQSHPFEPVTGNGIRAYARGAWAPPA